MALSHHRRPPPAPSLTWCWFCRPGSLLLGWGGAFASSCVGIFGGVCRRPTMVTQGRCCLLREWLSWEWAPQGSGSLNTRGVTMGTRITVTSGHGAPPASQSPCGCCGDAHTHTSRGLAGTGCARRGAAPACPSQRPQQARARTSHIPPVPAASAELSPVCVQQLWVPPPGALSPGMAPTQGAQAWGRSGARLQQRREGPQARAQRPLATPSCSRQSPWAAG